jgi:hypothetical protein
MPEDAIKIKKRSLNEFLSTIPKVEKDTNLFADKQSKMNAATVDEKILFYCELCDFDDTANYLPHLATYECVECNDKMCDILAKAHTLQKTTKHHQLVQLTRKPIKKESTDDIPVIKRRKASSDATLCNLHNETFAFFDEQCQRLNCIQCCMTEHQSKEFILSPITIHKIKT